MYFFVIKKSIIMLLKKGLLNIPKYILTKIGWYLNIRVESVFVNI